MLSRQFVREQPDAVRRAKRLIDDGMDRPLDAALDLEREVAMTHLLSEASKSGIERFRER
jgi:enoyl-CoA hydratase/carnithine racemase